MPLDLAPPIVRTAIIPRTPYPPPAGPRQRYGTFPPEKTELIIHAGWVILGHLDVTDNSPLCYRTRHRSCWVRARRPVFSWAAEPDDPLVDNRPVSVL